MVPREQGAFGQLQGQQPQTLAHALTDSPAGSSVETVSFRRRCRHEFAITNIAIYWFTGTSASSVRFYYENAHMDAPTETTTVPLGLASFTGDLKSIRRFIDRDHKNVVSWHEYTIGGHYAAHQVPGVFVSDLRGFFGELLADSAEA